MARYSYIKSLSLKEDDNEYRVGVTGSNESKKCDLYINDELVFQGIPFRKGNSICVLKSGYFIKVRDSHGNNIVIRDGEVVLTTRYNVVNAYAQNDCDYDGREFIAQTYLVVVSRNNLFGILSSLRGRMVLPIMYSTIDIDEYFNIVIGEKINLEQYDDELKKDILKCMRKGEYMRIGDYSKKDDLVYYKGARVNDDEVDIYDNWRIHYTWNDGFSDYEEEDEECSYINVPSDWDDYTYEDSLYDALGGEMDAKWNID